MESPSTSPAPGETITSDKFTPAETFSADTFYKGALKRTGTLYEGAGNLYSGAKEGVLKRSGTISEAAKGGLQRSGSILETAKEGLLKRTGPISLEGAKEGLMKRTGTISQGARAGFQQTGTYLGGAKDGLVQRTGSWKDWMTYAKGFYDPELALKASFREITGIDLRRANHSLAVINGRAYIFGGESSPGQFADNDMHVVILPSSSVRDADYKSITARPLTKDGPVPQARKNHTAAVIENEIYIFGGELSPKAPEEEAARVWVYDTISNKWSFHDPKPDAPYPPPRFSHAAVASNRPEPLQKPSIDLVEQEVDPSKTVPEPPESDTWGAMFIYGGKAVKEEGVEILNDAWVFDVRSREWLPLPPPPGPARRAASLILSEDRLYRAGGHVDGGSPGSTIDFLDVGQLFIALALGKAFNKIALPSLLTEWTSSPISNSASEAISVTEVAPGGGYRVLLSISSGASSVTAIDVSPTSNLRLTGAETPESEQNAIAKTVAPVKVRYVDAYGDILPAAHTPAFGQYDAFASSPGSEVEAASLVLWGGKDIEGNLLGNGWMLVVEW